MDWPQLPENECWLATWQESGDSLTFYPQFVLLDSALIDQAIPVASREERGDGGRSWVIQTPSGASVMLQMVSLADDDERVALHRGYLDEVWEGARYPHRLLHLLQQDGGEWNQSWYCNCGEYFGRFQNYEERYAEHLADHQGEPFYDEATGRIR